MERPNIEYINKLSRNEEAIKQKFIAILKFELPIEIDAYNQSIRLNKMEQTASCVHKLKHKIGLLGLEEGYYIAEEYENQLSRNEKKLQVKFENMLNLMRNFVNSL